MSAGIIGAHYPITKPGVQMPPPPPSCYEMDKPLWTSEGWDLGQVNDWKGAINLGAQRARRRVLPTYHSVAHASYPCGNAVKLRINY